MATDVEMTTFQERLAGLEREIARLSIEDLNESEFFRQFLEQVVSLLGVGGALWRLNSAGQMVCLSHMNLSVAGLQEQGQQYALLTAVFQKIMQTRGPIVLPAHAESNVFDGGMGQAGYNDSPHTLLFIPIIPVDQVEAIMLLISPTDVDPRAVRGYLGFVQGLGERAADFLQRRKIRQLQEDLNRSDRLRQFVSSLHTGLDPRRTCYTLANYAQEILGVYRCMAGTYSIKGKFRMRAVSGVESVAVKSSFIQSISLIAREVCQNDKVLLVDNPNAAMSESNNGGDDLLTAARLYMLQADSLVLGVFPIKWQQRVVGAMVIEKGIEQPIDADERRRIEALLTEAGSALANSMDYRQLPMAPVVRMLAAVRDRVYAMPRLKRAIAAILIMVICILPFLVTKQIKVVGNAELIPVNARIAYAQQDGIIESIAIPRDRHVQKGQVLASLDTREIDRELDRLTNSIGEAQLSFLEAQGQNQTARAQQYQYRLQALKAERDKLLLERNHYRITAPVTGQIITRDSELRMLTSKPVNAGEKIAEIVPDEADWDLLVRIPEDEAGELLRAWDNLPQGQKLQARVILNAFPDKTFRTEVVSVASRAHVQSTGQEKYRNVIDVRVKGPEELKKITQPRQGMEGKVAVECGRRTFFYAVTHEFVDFLRVSFF